ncbi:MAG: hypothetical protein AAF517_14655 [Planctomycetota bacterium]
MHEVLPFSALGVLGAARSPGIVSDPTGAPSGSGLLSRAPRLRFRASEDRESVEQKGSLKVRYLSRAGKAVARQAVSVIQKTTLGKSLIRWLKGEGYSVTVRFVDYTGMPNSERDKALGYCHPHEEHPDDENADVWKVNPDDDYTVWVRVSDSRIAPFQARPVMGVIDTLFHELLHAWWMSWYIDERNTDCHDTGKHGCDTGHSGGDPVRYHPNFLRRLKEHRRQAKIELQRQEVHGSR